MASAQAQSATTPPKNPTLHAAARHDSGHAAATPQWTKQQITDAQNGLKKAGFYKGTVNGVWNHETTEAVRAWQRANKMAVTGKLNDDELKKLRES